MMSSVRSLIVAGLMLGGLIAAAAEPLSRAGSTTIISNGGPGSGTGASKLSRDVTDVLTSTLPIVKELSGIDLLDVLRGAIASRDTDADVEDDGGTGGEG